MQSILQCRNFRNQVQEQHNRHTYHAEKDASGRRAGQRIPAPSPSDSSLASSVPRSEQSPGLECVDADKNEPFPETAVPHTGASNHTHGGLEGRDAELMFEAAEKGHEIILTELPHDAIRTLSRATTARSIGTKLGVALTGIAVRDRRTNEAGPDAGKVFVVAFEGENDPSKP